MNVFTETLEPTALGDRAEPCMDAEPGGMSRTGSFSLVALAVLPRGASAVGNSSALLDGP